jgi:hypothetical protein
MWREFGTYCSAECQAADRPGLFIGQAVFAFLAFIVSLGALILGYPLIPWVVFLLGSGFWAFYAGSMVNLGSKVKNSEPDPLSKDELEKICSRILFVAQKNQTPKGVPRKVLYADLRSDGYSNRTITAGIGHLLVSEKLRQVGFTHYVAVS